MRRPGTIAMLSVRELIEDAVRATSYPGTTPERYYEEVAAKIAQPEVGVFVGLEERIPVGLCIVFLPWSAVMMYPQVSLAFNRGRRDVARRIMDRVKTWITAAGHDRVIGVNLYRDDAVFIRGFRHFGAGKVIGSLIEFKA